LFIATSTAFVLGHGKNPSKCNRKTAKNLDQKSGISNFTNKYHSKIFEIFHICISAVPKKFVAPCRCRKLSFGQNDKENDRHQKSVRRHITTQESQEVILQQIRGMKSMDLNFKIPKKSSIEVI
jgi:hypothetical protein